MVVIVLVVMVTVMVIMVMVMIVTVMRLDPLCLGIAVHQRLDHLAQGILLQRGMRGQEAGEAGKDERLHRQEFVALLLVRTVLVAHRAGQGILEQPVQGGIQPLRIGSVRLREQRLRMAAEPRLERRLEPAILFKISAHSCFPRWCALHKILVANSCIGSICSISAALHCSMDRLMTFALLRTAFALASNVDARRLGTDEAYRLSVVAALKKAAARTKRQNRPAADHEGRITPSASRA
jgi:hypothetical protein